jgi:hypothetical protein
MAVMKDKTISTVVTMAKRISLISAFGFTALLPTRECRLGLGERLEARDEERRGRHFAQASMLARQGWICSG